MNLFVTMFKFATKLTVGILSLAALFQVLRWMFPSMSQSYVRSNDLDENW